MGERVLVVEDNPDLRHLYSTSLRLEGFDVKSVGDGFEALRSIERDAPDLVLLDLGLPTLSGESVANEVAASALTRHIPIVVVTGRPDTAPPTHAACVLSKPVALDELVRTVKLCLERPVPAPAAQGARRQPRNRPRKPRQ